MLLLNIGTVFITLSSSAALAHPHPTVGVSPSLNAIAALAPNATTTDHTTYHVTANVEPTTLIKQARKETIVAEPPFSSEAITANSTHALSKRQKGLPVGKFPLDHCKYNFRILWNKYRLRISRPYNFEKCDLLRFYIRLDTNWNCKTDGYGGTWIQFNTWVFETPSRILKYMKEVFDWDGNCRDLEPVVW